MRYTYRYTLADYGSMLRDEHRLESFCSAIDEIVRADDTVLELGAGTGFFSCFAARRAKKVHAVEFNPLIQLAEGAAEENGLKNVEVHHGYSFDVELASKAHVLIHDMKSQVPLTQGTRAAIQDALERLLVPGARLIPRRDRVFAALVHDPAFFSSVRAPWSQGLKGLTFESVLTHCAQQEIYERHKDSFRGPSVELLSLDYRDLTQDSCHGQTTFELEEEQDWHGLVLWVESELSDSVNMTTDPWAERPATAYGNAFTCFKQPLRLALGHTYSLALTLKDSGAVDLTLERDLGWAKERLHHSLGWYGSEPGIPLEATVEPGAAQANSSLLAGLAESRSIGDVLEQAARAHPNKKVTELGRTLYVQARNLSPKDPEFKVVTLECFSCPLRLRSGSLKLLKELETELSPAWIPSSQEAKAELKILRILSQEGEVSYQILSGDYRRNYASLDELVEAVSAAAFEILKLSLVETHIFLNGSLVDTGERSIALLGGAKEERLQACEPARLLSEGAVIIDPLGHPLAFGEAVGDVVPPLQELRFQGKRPEGAGPALLLLSSLCYRKGSPPLARLAKLLESCEIGEW